MNPAGPIPEEHFRRLHVATIVIEFLRVLGQMGLVIVFVVAGRLMGDGGDSSEIWFAALGGLGVLVAVFRYFSTRFVVYGGNLVIKTGLIQRQTRTIPLDRIQNINIKQTLVHRALGVVDLQIETAAGAGVEANLSALGAEEAEMLRRELRSETSAVGAFELPVHRPAIYEVPARDLAIQGLTENRAGAIVASVLGVGFVVDDTVENLTEAAIRTFERSFGMRPEQLWILFLLAGAGLLLVGWVFGLVWTIFRYHGFRITEEDGRIVRDFGLATKIRMAIPLPRVQTIRIDASWPRRKLGYCTIEAASAGSSPNAQAEQQGAGKAALVPIIPISAMPALVRRVFPRFDPAGTAWRRVSPLAIRRGFFGYFWFLLALQAMLAAGTTWWVMAGVPITIGLSLVLARARYRVTRFAHQDGLLLSESGLWVRRMWVIPEAKIQFVFVQQSPFQARLGLGSVAVSTAGGFTGAEATVPDLPLAEAEALADALSARAAASGMWLPDAV